jgi:thymidylate synthase (FAD)
MREQIVVRTVDMHSEKFGSYKIAFVKPAAASVELVTFTAIPKWTMYLTTRAYKGMYHTQDDFEYMQDDAIADIQKTKLQTPLEMIHMLWLLNDVTRAFTHQLVRYRVGTAFIQESMRFFGMKKTFKVLITGEAAGSKGGLTDVPWDDYITGATSAIENYVKMLDRGIPDQDARGVLPTNILTNIYFDCSLRTLQHIFPQRLCCQAQQGEWQPILREMRKLIAKKMGEDVEQILRAPYERGEDCGYRASFDRPCVWQKESTT